MKKYRRPLAALTARCLTAIAACLLIVAGSAARGEEKKPSPQRVLLAEGKVEMTAPQEWKRQPPRNRIIEHEFSAQAVEGDKINGRITVMGAGGSIDANINRWVAQFSQPDGKSTRDRTKIEKLKVNGMDVHIVDITGTFKDRPRGPLGPTTLRKDFRMLAAIIVTEKLGQYFVKLYGPKVTVAANEKRFKAMVKAVKKN